MRTYGNAIHNDIDLHIRAKPLCDLFGFSYRQFDYWRRNSILIPHKAVKGGTTLWYSIQDVSLIVIWAEVFDITKSVEETDNILKQDHSFGLISLPTKSDFVSLHIDIDRIKKHVYQTLMEYWESRDDY